MSYETAVASMFALGHELANTPSNKFDLAHMRVLLRGDESSRAGVSQRADCWDERKRVDRRDAGFDSPSVRIEDWTLHFAASGADQRTHPDQWRGDRRRRFCRAAWRSGSRGRTAGRAGRVAVASQLFRDDDGDCVCSLCARARSTLRCWKLAWADGWMRPTWSSRWSA